LRSFWTFLFQLNRTRLPWIKYSGHNQCRCVAQDAYRTQGNIYMVFKKIRYWSQRHSKV